MRFAVCGLRFDQNLDRNDRKPQLPQTAKSGYCFKPQLRQLRFAVSDRKPQPMNCGLTAMTANRNPKFAVCDQPRSLRFAVSNRKLQPQSLRFTVEELNYSWAGCGQSANRNSGPQTANRKTANRNSELQTANCKTGNRNSDP